jgi:alpha-L-rhamnosidase
MSGSDSPVTSVGDVCVGPFRDRGCSLTPTPTPRVSWRVDTSTTAWCQSAYEIQKTSAADGVTATTGRIESDESAHITWPFPALGSREQCSVRIRVWDDATAPTAWSEPVLVEAGLFDDTDWTARMIAPATARADTTRPGPGYLLRRDFTITGDGDGQVASARLYASAHGVFDVEINGVAVGDEVLAPGWTSYGHRLRYRTHDVATHLREGANAIGIRLADGWFRGPIGFEGGKTNLYGDHVAAYVQLEIAMTDGRRIMVNTDESWTSSHGPITSSGLYDGERHDARLEQADWSAPGFDASTWSGVEIIEFDLTSLEAPLGPPVRATTILEAITTEIRGRKVLLDFGQNASGRVRIEATGRAGESFTIRHAEVLENGELSLRPLRHARATDEYVFADDQRIQWEPRFTIHGFRYAEIELGEGVELHSAVSIVCHSDMERTGWFECSDPLLNRLHENVVWSMRGNFVDLPTDCPQRDERLGWTGDIAAFAPTATFLYDCSGFLGSWLRDLAVEQVELGTVPFYVPWVDLIFPPVPAAMWGDAAVFVPDALFQRYGDTELLRTQYESMCVWVDQVAAIAGPSGLWNTGFQFGDWLDPAAPPDSPAAARTDASIVATACLQRSAALLSNFATVLDRHDDAQRYADLAARVRNAFIDEYVTPAGRMASDAQTAYALSLAYGLLGNEQIGNAGNRLTKLVIDGGFHIGTGFVGTPLICEALTASGHLDAAYQLLTEKTCPSWLYPVTMGATTVWERWDSMLPDGSVNPGEMTSFNHYALGAVADWLHRTVAGLQFATPGGRTLRFAPRPGGGLTSAKATHRSAYGLASIAWERHDGELCVDVMVPPNCNADVELPDTPAVRVTSGSHRFTVPHCSAANDPKLPAPPTFREIVAAQIAAKDTATVR